MSGAATRSRSASAAESLEPDGESAAYAGALAGGPKQELLPPLRWLMQPDNHRFAHPAEVEFARLLTFYGVRWAYEPTTFALGRAGEGRGEEFVTPDFYLPDHDLYLELTTMRQRLVTRKNRKFRRLRELYPNVRVRILYLRDFQRLQEAVVPVSCERAGRLGATLYAEHTLEMRVAELAQQLTQNWQADQRPGPLARPLLLGLGAGSSRFLAALGEHVRARGFAIDLDRVDLTPMAGSPDAAKAQVTRPPALSLAGRSITIVQEVLSTGLSAAFLERWLRRHSAGSVEICTLLDREAARILDVPVTCSGFAAPDVALAGYGLTRWREFRDLPFVAAIESD